jgi:hypothetical protein
MRHTISKTYMVTFEVDPPIDDVALNALFARAWPNHVQGQHQAVLARYLTNAEV